MLCTSGKRIRWVERSFRLHHVKPSRYVEQCTAREVAAAVAARSCQDPAATHTATRSLLTRTLLSLPWLFKVHRTRSVHSVD